MFIDIHSHILYSVDDGSQSIEESLDILHHLVHEHNVSQVVLTPHIMSGAYTATREIIDQKIAVLRDAVQKAHLPITLFSGAEVYCEPANIQRVISDNLTIAKSNYVLFETDFDQIPAFLDTFVFQLQSNHYRPILAHPERYRALQRKPEQAINYANRGLLLQINAGSPLGAYGQSAQELALYLLDRGCVHCVGSDVHGLEKRPVLINDLYHFITDEYSEDYAKRIMIENPQHILNNEEIAPLPESFFDIQEPPKPRGFIDKIIDLFR